MPNHSPLRVLVVDDEPLIRWSLSETFGDHGYEVVEAGDASAAIDALMAGRPFDVVLLDFLLPDSRDLKLLSDVRHLVPDARVIMMTAHGTPEMVKGALDLGALQVLGKPFDVNFVAGLVADAAAPRLL